MTNRAQRCETHKLALFFGGWEGQGLACSFCCCHFGSRTILRVNFERFVHMVSTLVEMQSFTTVESVFVWAPLKGEPLQKCYTSSVLKMLITHEFWLLCRRLIRWGNFEVVRTCQSCVAGSESQSGGCKGGCSLENYWFACWCASSCWFHCAEYVDWLLTTITGLCLVWCLRLRKNSQLNSLQRSRYSSKATFVRTKILLHGNRMMRRLKLQGTTFSSDGSIITHQRW